MRVLVTGAGALLGQGIMQSMLRSNIKDLEIIAADPSPLSAGLYWTNERYLLPKANEPDFIESVDRLIKKTRPDLVIPGTDVELMPLALNRSRLERMHGTKILVSDPAIIEIANDKYKTFQFFRENGFMPPDSCLPGEELALIERVGFPLIVKPRTGARSVGVSKVEDIASLKKAIRATHNPVIQECVGTDDVEYTAGVIYFDGECKASIVMRRDLRDGNTYRAYVEKSPELNTQVRAFAHSLKPFGPANFQFRISNQEVRVFEINSRFSGTTPLRMLANFNEVEICLRHLLGGEFIVQPEVKEMTILRHWSETIVLPDMPPPMSI